jgi:outer membrane biosynthesis protein TonB
VKKSSLLPWVAVALLAHGAAYAASERVRPPVTHPIAPLEVELSVVDPEPLLPPSPPPEEEDEAPRQVAPVLQPVNVAPRRAPPSAPTVTAAAKVGALLTSGETPDSADPVAFFSDPQGGAYGSGVVARGGQVDHGVGPAAAPIVSAPPPHPVADEVTTAANLSRAPSLDEPDACRGFFPTEAGVDRAKVDLVVVVQPGGRVTSVSIARESPAGEGFGAAARTCLSSKRFTPGVDRAGRVVTAKASVRVHFMR